MKTYILFVALVLFVCTSSNAQMTLSHSYPMNSNAEAEVVNLSISGNKIMALNENSDTLFFYNLDYSLWKEIICPSVSGYVPPGVNFYDGGLGLGCITGYYPSETLFNLDTFLEVAVCYRKLSPSTTYTIFIVNENSVLTDSITNVSYIGNVFSVHQTATGIFKA